MSFTIGFLGLWLLLTSGTAGAQTVLSPTHYDLDLEVDYEAKVLRGTAALTVENPANEPVREASLLLYRLMQVKSVRDSDGQELAFSQAVVAFEDFSKLQVNQVVVTLAEPLVPGAHTAIEVQYEGHLLGYAETGMLYVKDRIDGDFTILRDDAYAYPQPGYPSRAVNRSAPGWSFSYSARITVPKGLVVANGGRREGADSHGETVTYRFSSLEPSWRMDFAIASYTELSAGRIRVYHLPGDSAGGAGVAKAAEKALDLFTKWFGPLRGAAALTFIEIPDGWGSQTDVTTIIQTAASFQDPERHHEVYHEVSHLWNVSPTDRPSPRWNEGLASFLEFLVTQEVTGKPVVDARANQLVEWLRGELSDHPKWRDVPLVEYGREGVTDRAYSVGALFFDLLYRLVGRETFNEIIGRYYADHGELGGSTKDLVEAIDRAASHDLSQLVNDWIYTTAWADRLERSTHIQAIEAHYRAGARRAGN